MKANASSCMAVHNISLWKWQVICVFPVLVSHHGHVICPLDFIKENRGNRIYVLVVVAHF